MCMPSGENATDKTKPLCFSIFITSIPVIASQIYTVLSSEPDTTCAPLGENATELTDPLCPSIIISIPRWEIPLHSMEGSPGKSFCHLVKSTAEDMANSVARLLT